LPIPQGWERLERKAGLSTAMEQVPLGYPYYKIKVYNYKFIFNSPIVYVYLKNQWLMGCIILDAGAVANVCIH